MAHTKKTALLIALLMSPAYDAQAGIIKTVIGVGVVAALAGGRATWVVMTHEPAVFDTQNVDTENNTESAAPDFKSTETENNTKSDVHELSSKTYADLGKELLHTYDQKVLEVWDKTKELFSKK